MTPPLGSMIVGPCPRCDETVLLFDGSVMPLDRDIIADGSSDEKKQHMLEVILDMAAGKIDELIDNDELGSGSADRRSDLSGDSRSERLRPSVRDKDAPFISREEVSDFVNIDLRLIDSKNYFDKVFASKKSRRKKKS
jgi:hypothetical protein